VLTLKGKTFSGRVAASLLACFGLPELVCDSMASYKSMALAIAADQGKARSLKERVAQLKQTSPLFDTERFTRALEVKYREILKR
jgi:predicted O-linked N-acetylglucosamine transferase (SPINDLY family)